MTYYLAFIDFIQQHKFLTSLVLLGIFFRIRASFLGWIRRRAKRKNKDKRPVINAIRNLSNLLVFGILLYVWAPEIQNVAISIAAFTVAIVFATREYIQCLMGFIYASSTRAFAVGDWVQIENYYGEVANMDWLKLSLLEIDPHSYGYTGKSLTVPNNKLVSHTIRNLNFLKRYAMHSFKITVEPVADVFEFVEPILERANHYCEHFSDVAQRYTSLIEHRLDISLHGVESDVRVFTNELGKTQLEISIFCPTEQAVEIEQKICRDFMQMWYQKVNALKTAAPTTNATEAAFSSLSGKH